MSARDEERLHERLRNGTADPGMYPECAEHVGMLDRGEEDRREAEARAEQQRIGLEYSALLDGIAADFNITREAAASIVARASHWLEDEPDHYEKNP